MLKTYANLPPSFRIRDTLHSPPLINPLIIPWKFLRMLIKWKILIPTVRVNKANEYQYVSILWGSNHVPSNILGNCNFHSKPSMILSDEISFFKSEQDWLNSLKMSILQHCKKKFKISEVFFSLSNKFYVILENPFSVFTDIFVQEIDHLGWIIHWLLI